MLRVCVDGKCDGKPLHSTSIKKTFLKPNIKAHPSGGTGSPKIKHVSVLLLPDPDAPVIATRNETGVWPLEIEHRA